MDQVEAQDQEGKGVLMVSQVIWDQMVDQVPEEKQGQQDLKEKLDQEENLARRARQAQVERQEPVELEVSAYIFLNIYRYMQYR